MKLQHPFWLLFISSLFAVVVAEFEPKVTEKHQPDDTYFYTYFDDSPNILIQTGKGLELSTDNGQTWKKVEAIPKNIEISELFIDRFDGIAYVLTPNVTQYFSEDKGLTWKPFEFKGAVKDTYGAPRITSNYADSKIKLVSFTECKGDLFDERCSTSHFYTTDKFKTALKELNVKADECIFARGSKVFTEGKASTIICIENTLNSFDHVVSSNLIRSDNFFKSKQVLNHAYSKTGKLVGISVKQNFILAVVQNDKFNKHSKITLLVSKDAKTFNAADLSTEVSFGAVQFLDSSPSSIFVSIAAFTGMFFQYGNAKVYSSDSSGLKFTQIAENVVESSVQKVQTIDGVWLANKIDDKDGEDTDEPDSIIDFLTGGGVSKSFKSMITFNNGKDWNPVKVVDDDDCKEDGCSLHFLTTAEEDGEGKFVTGPTPAILLGVGNSGKELTRETKKMKTFISRDGGVSWKKAIDEPCIFAFGDLGNIIVAVPYLGYGDRDTSSKYFYYSLDQGLTWSKKDFKTPFYPLSLTTTIDGTGTNFLISGLIDKTPDNQDDYEFNDVLYALDFSKAFDRKCKDGDYEEIYARHLSKDQKSICMYGHRERFRRRKADAKCFAATLYEDLTVYDESCECTEFDFECAPGFKLDKKGKICEPDGPVISQMCKAKDVESITLPDKVSIDGNECSMGKKSMKDFVTEHTLDCSEYHEDDRKKTISSHKFDFEDKVVDYAYFEQGKHFQGENILIRTDDDKLYASRDGGLEFVKVPIYDKIGSFTMGPIPGQVVLGTDSERIYISTNAGNSYAREDGPGQLVPPYVSFHKTKQERMIVYVLENKDTCFGNNYDKSCKKNAYITRDRGESFKLLKEGVFKCDFVSSYLKKGHSKDDDLIHCAVVDYEKKTLNIVSSSNDFKDEKVVGKNTVGYAISGNYVIVGEVDEKSQSLKALVTEDGKTFAEVKIPHDVDVNLEQAFTVLDAETGSIFLHITTSAKDGFEYGAILKSNSNGTSYALSLDNVNRNSFGFVDYDRIEGIEGILISNVVSNYRDKKDKKLKTMISHSDGGEWNYITPPKVDSKRKKYKCSGKTLKDCSLNLHGFTEREDYRDTFSSPSAIGLMIGIGNVGPHLTEKKKGDTFLTRDGGVTWNEVRKGNYMWEYGDRGSILVLVKDGDTNKVSYSLDQGYTWEDYEFTKEEVLVTDIATVPSDNSRKFMIFTRKSGKTSVFTIDFSDIYTRQCQLDLDNPDNDDFEYWSPRHPQSTGECLFGHEAKYLRRAKGHEDCFIGMAPLKDGFKITKNCSCTRADFECDYNYWRDSDNTCKLVKGLSPSDHKKEMCKNNAFEYFEPTGYRKVPLSTCEGGKRFDAFVPQPCPGKAKEFNDHYGRNVGFGKLMLILGIPGLIFIFATWFVYDRGIRRNGGFKQFGQIRLDDDEFDFHPIENNQVDKAVNAIVKGGINVAAVLIGTFKALRKLDTAYSNLLGRLFRGSAGRRSYVNVPNISEEEDELFGNFRDNYEDELEHGDEDLRDNFNDFEDDAPFDDDPSTVESDERLFDIDDQSDEEEPTPQDSEREGN